MAQSSSRTQKFPSPPVHDNGAQQAINAVQEPMNPPPVVRALTPDESDPLLPLELQHAILNKVPRSAIPQVGLVCRRWRSYIDDMRVDIPLRADLIELNGTSQNIFAKQFNVHLQNIHKCHPAFLHGALRDIAELLKHVHAKERQACFTALLDRLPQFSGVAQRWLLCNLAVRADYYQKDIASGGSERHGAGFAQAILDAASKQPVVGQALIVAALIDGMHIKNAARSPLAGTFGEMAKRWREGATPSEAWADLLVRGLADFLISSDWQRGTRFVQVQFGYYRMPLPDTYDEVELSSDTSMPGSAGVNAFSLCSSILQSDLAWEEKRCLLMFPDHPRHAMTPCPRKAARMFAVLENLVNDMSTFAELIENSDESGATLLGRALGSNQPLPIMRWRTLTEPWLRVHAACIAASRKLSDADKVRILRAHTRAPVAERKPLANQPSPYGGIRLGRWQEASFHGVSAIDSLFRDSAKYLLEGYMRVILDSPLSDDVKARVLRLDYPDRTGQPGMLVAHRTYSETVLASSLREELKDWLLDGVLSDWQPSCSVM